MAGVTEGSLSVFGRNTEVGGGVWSWAPPLISDCWYKHFQEVPPGAACWYKHFHQGGPGPPPPRSSIDLHFDLDLGFIRIS